MTSREQFEKWFKSDYHPDKSGPYLKDALFLAWQASRAAVEINLPAKNDISDEDRQIPDLSDWDDGRNSGIQECVESIRTAGIKVKDC